MLLLIEKLSIVIEKIKKDNQKFYFHTIKNYSESKTTPNLKIDETIQNSEMNDTISNVSLSSYSFNINNKSTVSISEYNSKSKTTKSNNKQTPFLKVNMVDDESLFGYNKQIDEYVNHMNKNDGNISESYNFPISIDYGEDQNDKLSVFVEDSINDEMKNNNFFKNSEFFHKNEDKIGKLNGSGVYLNNIQKGISRESSFKVYKQKYDLGLNNQNCENLEKKEINKNFQKHSTTVNIPKMIDENNIIEKNHRILKNTVKNRFFEIIKSNGENFLDNPFESDNSFESEEFNLLDSKKLSKFSVSNISHITNKIEILFLKKAFCCLKKNEKKKVILYNEKKKNFNKILKKIKMTSRK